MDNEEIKNKILLLLNDNAPELDSDERVKIKLIITNIINSLDTINSLINFILIILMLGIFIGIINQIHIVNLVLGIIYFLLLHFKCSIIIKLINKLNIIMRERLK